MVVGKIMPNYRDSEVERLEVQLELTQLAYETLESAYNVVNDGYNAQKEKIDRLERESRNLRYDLDNPWWKFW